MRYLGYEVCLLACRIAGVPDRQCNAFHRAQTCQPEGDSRSGFLPAGLPSFPVPRRAQRLLVFSFDYSACGQPIASSDLAAYCSAATASHHYSKTRFCNSPFDFAKFVAHLQQIIVVRLTLSLQNIGSPGMLPA